MKLTKEELYNITGGAISAAFLNSLARIFGTVIDLGKMIGSAIRKISSKNYC